MLAGGKQKMLTLAGSKANIVGLNPALTAGVIDETTGSDASPERTDRKVAWVKEGAGDRFDSITLQTRIHLAMITDDRDAVAREMAPLIGLSVDDAIESPHSLVGTVTQVVDDVKRMRDRWGITYISIDAQNIDDLAPVIEALDGA